MEVDCMEVACVRVDSWTGGLDRWFMTLSVTPTVGGADHTVKFFAFEPSKLHWNFTATTRRRDIRVRGNLGKCEFGLDAIA